MQAQVAKLSMLIHCEAADAFDAFVNPQKITRFWLTAASGPLAPNAKVEWEFRVPGVTDTLKVTEFQSPHRLAFEWSDGSRTSLYFEAQAPGKTVVRVEAGLGKDASFDDIVNTTEGYAIVLCDLKTFLETGRSANLVRDKAALITATMQSNRN
jgi:uncharacterized protein YndB with AHSA1/START domain